MLRRNEGEAEGGFDLEEPEKIETVDDLEVVKHLGYSQGMVNAVLVVMFCLGLLVNVDHGALPAALRDISQSLNLDESVMGTMGSAVFFGLILGSCTASFIFKKFSYKLIIVSSLVLNGLSLGLFSAGSNFNFMLFARVISGFS